MNARTRTSLIVAAPLVAVATLAVGLRVGAGSAFHAALVYAAPPGAAAVSGGKRPYAFQLTTYLEEGGVREVVAMRGLRVIARADDGQESTWSGESNVDGIAEVALAFAGAVPRVALRVEVAGEREALASGVVDMNDAPARPRRSAEPVRPSKREGSLGVDVFVEGDRLVVGAPTSLLVVVSPPVVGGPLTARATPELGVRFEREEVRSPCGDVAELRAFALGQAASTLVEVASEGGAKGTWFGTLPTAPGAFAIDLPRVVGAAARGAAVLVAPNARERVYLEIDGEEGRELGIVLPLQVAPGDPLPRARLELPPLAPGLHFLVASGDPRGAEHMGGATIAKGFRVVAGDPAPTAGASCEDALAIARQGALAGFPRWLAIDGIATRGADNRARRRRGLFIGLFALGAAALLEVLLLTAAAREAKLVLEQAASDAPERVTAKPPGGGLVVALLVAVLGFAFLAALVVAKA